VRLRILNQIILTSGKPRNYGVRRTTVGSTPSWYKFIKFGDVISALGANALPFFHPVIRLFPAFSSAMTEDKRFL